MSESPNLASMKLVELKSLAGSLGIKGTSAMRKGDLVTAIQSASSQGSAPAAERPRRRAQRPAGEAARETAAQETLVADEPAAKERSSRCPRRCRTLRTHWPVTTEVSRVSCVSGSRPLRP